MSNEYVTVRNKDTRKVGLVRRRVAESDVLGKRLEIVPDGSKSYVGLDELVQKGREPETVDDLVKLEDFDIETDYEKEDEA